MEIEGKIIRALELMKGEGKAGQWKKQSYILETSGSVPRKICFTVWGDKIDQFDILEGDVVKVGIDIESREFNGKWYTDIKAWKVEKAGSGKGIPPVADEPPPMMDESDDLPF